MSKTAAAFILLAALGASGCGALNPGRELPDIRYQQVHPGAEALHFDADSGLLASGGWEGEVALWRPGQAAPLLRFKAHDSFVHGIAFATEGLVTAAFDGRIHVWDRGGALLAARDTGVAIDKMIVMGARVISAHHDGVLRYWRLPELNSDGEIALHQRPFAALAGHPQSGRIATSGYDGMVFVLSANGTPRRLEAPPTDARSLAFSDDGRQLFAGGWFRLFRWELEDGELAVLKTGHWGVISSIQFAPGENAVASISRVNDSAVLFLDPDSGETVRDLRRHPVCGTTLALSPDGRYLANTGDDGMVRIFDLKNPKIR